MDKENILAIIAERRNKSEELWKRTGSEFYFGAFHYLSELYDLFYIGLVEKPKVTEINPNKESEG